MTLKAKRFIEANRQSPIVYGSALGGERGPDHVTGCFYRLKDGRTFELSIEDCRAVPAPRWIFEEQAA